ncbi:response regulator [Fulvivirga ligni]|uniref:response regulator n=1 Tax=Fulvivirga ligni TaxID=2904246 RepID=UPI001F22E23A|nr:response regulator [Fulvivirga ligni]UII20900.1 response regulator [Fulvivirga ligni]
MDLILLIDDDKDDNFLHTRTIKKSDITKEVASFLDAEDALAYLKSAETKKPDLIFLDINMPKMNGWDFLNEYTKLPDDKKGSIVVMLTTSVNPDDKHKALSFQNVVSYTNKPLTQMELLDLIKKVRP